MFRISRVRLSVLVALGGIAVTSAHGQGSIVVLGHVTVTAAKESALPAGSILTSVDVVEGDLVRDKNVKNSWELMGQMPGIQLTEFGLGAESGKPSFRAFNGEGYINGIKLLIDGLPSNVNSGNLRYMDMIFPADIDYVEVVRGTNDPRYGLHNIGGNINVATRRGGNYTEGRLTYGSFDTAELQATLGREANGFAQNYFFAAQKSDGHRDHSDSEKYGAGGKWFFAPNSDIDIGVIARAYKNNAQEPGYLTAAELAADRDQSPAKNAHDHDKRQMEHLSGHLTYRPNPRSTLNSKLYFNSIDDDRFVTYTSNAASTAPRQRRHWVEDHYGWLNSLTWSATDTVTLDGGFNVERQDNEYRRHRFAYAVPTDFSTPVTTSNNEDYTLNNVGAYVQAIIKPAEGWKIVPAYRIDRFTGRSTKNATGVTSRLQHYGWIEQPKLSIVYSPTPAASIYANWGRTFQILTGSTSPAYLTTGTASYDPSINTGYELGAKFRLASRIEGRVAAWQQDATNEVANLPSAGATQNLGETRRKGIDLQLTAMVSDSLKLWASHSIQQAKIRSGYSSGGVSLTGKEVFSTPRHISNIGADYRATERLSLGLQGRAQGRYYIDDLNTQGKHGGYALVDGSIRYDVSKTVGVDLQVKNLFDRKYAYVWYDNFFWPAGSFQPMYSPGPGRAAYVSLNLKY